MLWFGPVTFFLGLTAIGLVMLDNWLALYLSFAIWGICSCLLWAAAASTQTVEYWRGDSARWIYFLFGHPVKAKKYLKYANIKHWIFLQKYSKVIAMVPGLLLTALAIMVAYNAAIVSPVTWLVGIIILEIYFRRRYTLIKDWSKFKPFDEFE